MGTQRRSRGPPSPTPHASPASPPSALLVYEARLMSPRGRQALDADGFVAKLAADPGLAAKLACVRQDDGRDPEHAPLPDDLPPVLANALRKQGFSQLWTHQREAIERAMAGENVAIATETSSGKSLCFHAPVLAATLTDPQAHALYLFPTNPLANDQLATLQRLVAALPEENRPRGPVRLQGAMGSEKERLAAADPQIVFTNPEMAHLHLLPKHAAWQRLWRGLRYIVVDEIHLYRGAFGGHLANLIRRIRRCAWRHGSKPVVIVASATVANPRALAEELCAAPFSLVDRSAAPRGPRTTVLWRPEEGSGGGGVSGFMEDSVDLFRRALDAGLPSILFARSRQLVEQLVILLEERTGRSRVALGVRAYRGGYKRDEREAIEAGLRNGSVRGVVTTSALEVGIDIGALEVCIIAGYPGTIMATRQQAGRVGRRDRSSAVFLVSRANPLDNYLLNHPELLLDGGSERAVVGRLNPNILSSHLACAAREFPLWEAEVERLGGDVARKAVSDLLEQGVLVRGRDGHRDVYACRSWPHRGVSLRSASDERFTLVDPDGEEVGELDGGSVQREAHPGAIYLHQGRTFRVERHEENRIHLRRAQPGTSTRVQAEREVRVGDVRASRVLAGGRLTVKLAEVEVVDRFTGYLDFPGRARPPRLVPLDPQLESSMRTEALVLEPGPQIAQALNAGASLQPGPSLHGAEHLLSAFVSSLVLCDREDIEGHSAALPSPHIVLFDRHPGGIGFVSAAFEVVEDLVARTAEAIASCDCDDGCPACVHNGRCLRSKEEVSKAGARLLLAMASGTVLPKSPGRRRPSVAAAVKPKRTASKRLETKLPASVAPVEAGTTRRKRLADPSDESWKPSLKVGDAVEHAIYGPGEIVAAGARGRFEVRFDDGEHRLIVPGWLRPADDPGRSADEPGQAPLSGIGRN